MNVTPDSPWDVERQAMVNQLKAYHVTNQAVLAAMLKVPRHAFIPEEFRNAGNPYGDHPLPIGHDQTISQPFIVAYMTEAMQVRAGEKVLEIGTGSGYQAAVLAELGAEVYSVEIRPEFATHAAQTLARQAYTNVHIRTGDGFAGWAEQAPFDVIIVTCAPEEIPAALTAQLRDGGRMILPLGTGFQRLVILRKEGAQVTRVDDLPVRFVPMSHGKARCP